MSEWLDIEVQELDSTGKVSGVLKIGKFPLPGSGSAILIDCERHNSLTGTINYGQIRLDNPREIVSVKNPSKEEVDMPGILETILEEVQTTRKLLDAINARLLTGGAAQVAPTALAATTGLSNGHAQPAADPFAPAAPVQPVQPAITDETVMALITPYLDNAPIKAAFTAQLQAMGIAKLPDTRPDQLPELYNRFQQVIQQHAGQTVAAAAPSGIL